MTENPILPDARLYLSARGVGLAAGLIGAVVTARVLGPEGRGSLGLFVFLVALGAAVFGLGLPTAAYDLARRSATAAQAWGGIAFVATLAGSLSAAGVLVLDLLGWVNDAFGGVGVPVLAIAAGIGVTGTVLVQTFTMAAVAQGAARRAAAGQALPSVFAAAAYVGTLLIFGSGLAGAILWYGLAILLAAAVTWRISTPAVDPDSATGPRTGAIRTLLMRGSRVVVSDIANILSYRVDVTIVAALGGLAALGRYSVGVQLVEPLWLAASALAMSIMGAAAGPSDPASLERGVALAARISVLVCLAGGTVVTLIAYAVGGALLGPGFETVPAVMAILVPGVAAIAASKVLAGAVIGRGGLGVGSLVASATVALGVTLDVVLVPRFAELGAALASTVAYGLSTALWLRAWRGRGGGLGFVDLLPRPSDAMLLFRAITERALPSRTRP